MPYVLSEIIPEACRKLGPFATSTEAMSTACPTGTSFHNYTEEGGQTLKVCCPMPARLTKVPSVNAPNPPVTPLDCPRGSYFVPMPSGEQQCAYCFPVTGGEACPGIPGIGRYQPTPPTPLVALAPPLVVAPQPPALVPLPEITMPASPVTTLIQVTPAPKAVEAGIEHWVAANWKLVLLGAVGSAAIYYFARRKTALSGLDDYCAEFLRPDQFEPGKGVWTRGRCYTGREGAEAHASNLRSGGHSARVVEV